MRRGLRGARIRRIALLRRSKGKAMQARFVGMLAAGLLCAPAVLAGAAKGWPLQIPGAESITVYQPQAESLKDSVLSSRTPFSGSQRPGEPVFAALWLSSRVSGDANVTLQPAKVTRLRFPGSDDAHEQALQDSIDRALAARGPQAISHAALQESLAAEEKARASVEEIK